MLLVISPSKTQYLNGKTIACRTQPLFLTQTRELVRMLAGLTTAELADLMKISPKLAKLTFRRYQSFTFPFTPKNSGPALSVFSGDQFDSLNVDQYEQKDFLFAQDHLRILSGLYGVLRPLDLMQPYRLEMATKLAVRDTKTLYAFWRRLITDHLNSIICGQQARVLVNLASDEYFKAVQVKNLQYPVLKISFKEIKNGKARVIAIYAKRARGMMVDYVIRYHVSVPESLKKFSRAGYKYSGELSTQREWVFIRSPG
jgi:cytoplasmic iron level regulating protein YaaA (DUF328/UPF0246 family)